METPFKSIVEEMGARLLWRLGNHGDRAWLREQLGDAVLSFGRAPRDDREPLANKLERRPLNAIRTQIAATLRAISEDLNVTEWEGLPADLAAVMTKLGYAAGDPSSRDTTALLGRALARWPVDGHDGVAVTLERDTSLPGANRKWRLVWSLLAPLVGG